MEVFADGTADDDLLEGDSGEDLVDDVLWKVGEDVVVH